MDGWTSAEDGDRDGTASLMHYSLSKKRFPVTMTTAISPSPHPTRAE